MKSALISLAMVHAAAAGVATCNTGQVPDLTDADAAYNIDRTDWDGTEAGCTGGICLMSWQGVNPWIVYNSGGSSDQQDSVLGCNALGSPEGFATFIYTPDDDPVTTAAPTTAAPTTTTTAAPAPTTTTAAPTTAAPTTCASSPCPESQSCTNTDSGFTCHCPRGDGYLEEPCELCSDWAAKHDYCGSNAQQTCRLTVNFADITCACDAGYFAIDPHQGETTTWRRNSVLGLELKCFKTVVGCLDASFVEYNSEATHEDLDMCKTLTSAEPVDNITPVDSGAGRSQHGYETIKLATALLLLSIFSV